MRLSPYSTRATPYKAEHAQPSSKADSRQSTWQGNTKEPFTYGIRPGVTRMTHTEHTPAWILAGEQVGRAIARDAIAEGMPLTWTGIDPQDGDVLLSAGLEPDTAQWDAAESAARDEFYRCTSQCEMERQAWDKLDKLIEGMTLPEPQSADKARAAIALAEGETP
jgi:hypothetical protein